MRDFAKPVVLNAAKLPDRTMEELDSAFELLRLPPEKEAAEALLRARGGEVRGMTLRKTIVDRAMLDALPALEIIASYSAGLENLDTAETAARGITVTNSSHILARDVANLATGLVLALTRDIPNADAFVRAGAWPGQPQYRLTRSVTAMTIGVLGLGAIGSALAERLAALGASVVYGGPRPKPVDLRYYADLREMAAASDLLVVTCPLLPETRGAISAEVLEALGPRGYLVNISRGRIVDEAALIDALARDAIAGAALDVFEREPEVPAALIEDRRVILTPHIGSGTEETRQAMADNVVDQLTAKLGVAPLVR
ncbi:2-hydroxyacid dehydrogenase [Amaricoccus solimangrovi]|uniref:2-hydroxyacid dehydrogenase n=1 Tax=Amaricoccus solimangrovi TaxID=2589815 RepID=A0A501WBA7_9RHOB|nr:2-hydroxyacid dehydrogenase [Amaricoccus solimangrovi]TPE46899.1 2-hydroxyacid dehydrogenase [Amaricoccus solimangrovi]